MTEEDTLLLLSTVASDPALVLHISRYCGGKWDVQVSFHLRPYVVGVAEEDSLGGALSLAISRFVTNRDAPLTSILSVKSPGKKPEKISLDEL
jgi:hypothetical protein